MAGKTKSMSQIKQLLLLKKQNVSNRKAALQVGMDKETVNNYVRKANADPLGIDGLLSMQRSTDPLLFKTACQTAIEHQRYNYKFVRQLVDSKCIGVGLSESQCPPDHANIRGKKQFL